MGSCRPMMDHKPTLEFIGSLGRLEEVLNTLIHPANEAILQWCGHRGACQDCQDGLGDTETPENKSEDFELLRASRYFDTTLRSSPSLRTEGKQITIQNNWKYMVERLQWTTNALLKNGNGEKSSEFLIYSKWCNRHQIMAIQTTAQFEPSPSFNSL